MAVGPLLACWLLFPLVLLVLCTGCGLLAERLSGAPLPGALVPPAGFAVVIVLGGFLTLGDATARFAPAACAGAAVLGLLLGTRRLRPGIDSSAAAAALGVFLIYGAPVLMSGEATFTGYIKLDDTATWLALTDQALAHGRDLAGLAPSTYEATLSVYTGTGYPLGSFLPWGVGRAFTGQDLIWLFQPYIAFVGALLAVAAYSIARELVERRTLAAAAAFVAAQPALLYGYSLWGGVKEVVAACLLALVAALTTWSLRHPEALARPVPLAAAIAATVIALSVGGGVWIAAALLGGAAILAVRARRALPVVASSLRVSVAAAVLAIPALATASSFVKGSAGLEAKSVAGTGEALGNLLQPLSVFQLLGVWPTGDFRVRPGAGAITVALIAVVAAGALAGLWFAARRGAWGLLLYVGSAVVGCAAIAYYGSPWVDGKALATASPVFVLAAAAAAAFLLERGRLVPALLLAAPLAVGLAWSNVAAYREVNLAPRAQLHELESIGKRFSGQGPALITDYQPYGARHLLRKLDAEGASELRRRQVPLRDAPQVPKGGFSDIDEFQLEGLAPYRTLVIRRSPAASRPSSSFDLAWRGTWYEVWRRRPGAPPVVEHLPAGDVVQPSGRVACAEVRRLAREAGRGGRLATGLRPRVTALALSAFAHPPSWTVPGTTHLLPSSAGIVKGPVAIDTPGRYRVWIGGSFHGRLAVEVDGRSLGSRRHVLNQTGGYVPFGATPLGRGTHQLELRYARPAASPGSAGPPYPLGPLVLATGTAERKVTYVEPSAARSLCERPVDWVEAVGPA